MMAGTGVLVRTCEAGVGDCLFGEMFYLRLTDVGSWEPYDDMFVTWSNNNNVLHEDFELYSTF